jgi:hypothetical protein
MEFNPITAAFGMTSIEYKIAESLDITCGRKAESDI